MNRHRKNVKSHKSLKSMYLHIKFDFVRDLINLLLKERQEFVLKAQKMDNCHKRSTRSSEDLAAYYRTTMEAILQSLLEIDHSSVQQIVDLIGNQCRELGGKVLLLDETLTEGLDNLAELVAHHEASTNSAVEQLKKMCQRKSNRILPDSEVKESPLRNLLCSNFPKSSELPVTVRSAFPAQCKSTLPKIADVAEKENEGHLQHSAIGTNINPPKEDPVADPKGSKAESIVEYLSPINFIAVPSTVGKKLDPSELGDEMEGIDTSFDDLSFSSSTFTEETVFTEIQQQRENVGNIAVGEAGYRPIQQRHRPRGKSLSSVNSSHVTDGARRSRIRRTSLQMMSGTSSQDDGDGELPILFRLRPRHKSVDYSGSFNKVNTPRRRSRSSSRGSGRSRRASASPHASTSKDEGTTESVSRKRVGRGRSPRTSTSSRASNRKRAAEINDEDLSRDDDDLADAKPIKKSRNRSSVKAKSPSSSKYPAKSSSSPNRSVLATEKELCEHRQIHYKVGTFNCQFCPKSFAHRNSLSRHQAAQRLCCPICREEKEEMLCSRHTPSAKRFKCRQCTKEYVREYHWKIHQLTHTLTSTKREIFVNADDNIDDAMVSRKENKYNVKNVQIVCAPVSSFMCKFCDMLFPLNEQARQHEEMHRRIAYPELYPDQSDLYSE